MKKTWIKDYEGLYWITPCGRIFSEKRRGGGGELKPHLGQHYLYVGLCKNNKVKRYYVHRLVAETFLTKPENCNEVNHIDENKLNNCVNNLEWTTHAGNMRHSLLGKKLGPYSEVHKQHMREGWQRRKQNV